MCAQLSTFVKNISFYFPYSVNYKPLNVNNQQVCTEMLQLKV